MHNCSIGEFNRCHLITGAGAGEYLLSPLPTDSHPDVFWQRGQIQGGSNMAETMKAGVITAPYEYEVRELPVREPGPGEVLLRQRACAICTMEQRVFTGARKFPYPGCWGH